MDEGAFAEKKKANTLLTNSLALKHLRTIPLPLGKIACIWAGPKADGKERDINVLQVRDRNVSETKVGEMMSQQIVTKENQMTLANVYRVIVHDG